MNKKSPGLYAVIGVLTGSYLGLLIRCSELQKEANKMIPKTEQIQESFISPDRIKMTPCDINQDNQYETNIQIDNMNYILKENSKGPYLTLFKTEYEQSLSDKLMNNTKR